MKYDTIKKWCTSLKNTIQTFNKAANFLLATLGWAKLAIIPRRTPEYLSRKLNFVNYLVIYLLL